MVGGVAGEDVGEAGLDAHADQREQPALAPRVGRRELSAPSMHADLFVRALGCGSDKVIAMSR